MVDDIYGLSKSSLNHRAPVIGSSPPQKLRNSAYLHQLKVKKGCSFGKTRIVEPKARDSRKNHDEDGTLN
jgi:hypothetical protein